MSGLRVSVHTVPPVPCVDHVSHRQNTTWSPETCTLIYSENEAVLVDTAITINQNKDLIKWIERTAPRRKLSYIYITHGHADHFLGLPLLLQHFPEAKAVATEATVRHIEQAISEPAFSSTWVAFFPGDQLSTQHQLPEALPKDNKFLLQNRWTFEAIECGHSDTFDSTVLWVPDLRLAVCGDVVYGDVHQMLFEANTREKREEWIRAVEKVEALNPVYVVPGHRNADEMDGIWHLEATKKYIRDFMVLLEEKPQTVTELYSDMLAKYPNRFNPMVLGWGCSGAYVSGEVPSAS
ncbi:beta-lactamase-like protein [Aspergillus californicus]